MCVVLVYPSSSSPYALCIGVVQNAGHRGSGGSHFRSQGKVSQQYCWQINQLGADDCSPKQDGKKGKEEEEPTTNTTTTTTTKLADCHSVSTLLIVPTLLYSFSRSGTAETSHQKTAKGRAATAHRTGPSIVTALNLTR